MNYSDTLTLVIPIFEKAFEMTDSKKYSSTQFNDALDKYIRDVNIVRVKNTNDKFINTQCKILKYTDCSVTVEFSVITDKMILDSMVTPYIFFSLNNDNGEYKIVDCFIKSCAFAVSNTKIISNEKVEISSLPFITFKSAMKKLELDKEKINNIEDVRNVMGFLIDILNIQIQEGCTINGLDEVKQYFK